MRQSNILIICFVIFVLAFLGYSLWQSKGDAFPTISKEQREADLKAAEKYLHDADPERSLPIIHSYKEEMEKNSPEGKKWMNLFVEASNQLNDIDQLLLIFDYNPLAFSDHEPASITLANTFIKAQEEKEFTKIRELWRNRETNLPAWTLLDSDALALQGNSQQAYAILKNQVWTKPYEDERVMRIAMLKMQDNPRESLDIIDSSFSKDPKNPEIRLFRAKIYETMGQNSEAELDYLAAAKSDPKDVYLQDQLAEFYRRQKNFNKALNVWQKTLTYSTNDQIWMKNIFWSQIATPAKQDWKKMQLPEEKSRPFLVYALSLKPGEYWNQTDFEKIPHSMDALVDYQATYWLRLLQALKKHDEKTADAFLRNNAFHANSWAPLLEMTLRRIINYRQKGSLLIEGDTQSAEALLEILAKKDSVPQLYWELDHLAQKEADQGSSFEMPSEMKNLLKSDDVFAVALLSEGWIEAGLQMSPAQKLPENFPDWVAALYIQALKQNRGDQVALKYASMQNQTPIVILLSAEMEMSAGKTDELLEQLDQLQSQPGAIGRQAAWLTSLLDIKKGRYSNAKKIITEHPDLLSSLQGQEALGRIAVLQGKSEEAAEIYHKILQKSNEAKSYLARLAYQQKNWPQARAITEELLKEFPGNRQLQGNLEKIIAEEKKMH